MFVPTSRQRNLFESEALLSDGARRRLKESWAAQFAESVLPILMQKEGEFEGLYGSVGRPNWSAARMLGLCILRELTNQGSDQEVVDSLAFDARFQHALGLTAGDAYLSRRSLVEFRSRLSKYDPEGKLLESVFDAISEAAIADMGISVGVQRIDSTYVRSNIALRGRTALLVRTLEQLLEALSEAGKLESVDAEMQSWFRDDKGWERRLTFDAVARWLWQVLGQFAADDGVSTLEAYMLAKSVFAQHVRVKSPSELDDDEPDDDPPPDKPSPSKASEKNAREKAKAKARKQAKAQRDARRKNRGLAAETTDTNDISSATKCENKGLFTPSTELGVERIQSLHDQDARLGHKGVGYLAHVAETSGNKGKPEILTHVKVVAANVNDSTMTTSLLEDIVTKGVRPATALVDAGYTSGDNLVRSEARGIELLGPVVDMKKSHAVTPMTRVDFTFDDEGRVLECPEGIAPIRHARVATSAHRYPQEHAFFNKSDCQSCPRREACPVKDITGRRTAQLMISEGSRRRDARLIEQRESEFRARYSMRSGVEATASELKRAHGAAHLTVRGHAKVRDRILLKATGCNAKRWLRYRAESTAQAA